MKRLAAGLFLCLTAVLSLYAADAFNVVLSPQPHFTATNSTTINTHPVDAATDGLYGVIQAHAGDTVTIILIRHGVTTGDPPAYIVCIYSVGTDGLRGSALACALYDPPTGTGNDNTIRALTITHDGAGTSISSLATTKGTAYAISVEPCQGSTAPCAGASTPDASNNATFGYGWAGFDGTSGFPYTVTITAGAHAKITNRGVFGFGMRSATATYGIPAQTVGSTQISSGDEQGVSLTVPSGWCSTYKLAGVRWASVTSGAAAKTVKMVLYNGTTVLQTLSIDTDHVGTTGGVYERMWSESSLSTLTCGSTYRVGFAPQDASTNFALTRLVLPAAGDRSAFPGNTIVTYTTRTACGAPCDTTSTAWSDTTTERPLVEFMISDITAPAGGSGGSFVFVH